MSAYDDVKRDVITEYQQALLHAAPARHQNGGVDGRDQEGIAGARDQEGLADAMSAPAVRVSGSQPAWLGARWREALVVAALIGTAAGLALMGTMRSSGVAAAFSGTFAITALIVSYFTVAGFGNATFSIGSGPADSPDGGKAGGTNSAAAPGGNGAHPPG